MSKVASDPSELHVQLCEIEAERKRALEALDAAWKYICGDLLESSSTGKKDERYQADRAVIEEKYRQEKEEIVRRLGELKNSCEESDDEQSKPKSNKKRKLDIQNIGPQHESALAIRESSSITDLSRNMDSTSDRLSDEVDKASNEESSAESVICINDDGDDDNEGEENLTTEEHQQEKTRIQESKLQITLQGLRQVGQRNDKHLPESTCRQKASRKATTSSDHVIFDRFTFRQGRCYHYRTEKIDAIVGIVDFAEANALCVLVVPFRETFLGTEDPDVDYKATYIPPMRFVRVRQDEPVVLQLGNLKCECVDPYHIPKLVYEPQEPGSWYNFAYFYDNKKQRCGRRLGGLRVLELFAGAGGMAQGFLNAGFTTVRAVEQDCTAIETFSKNHPGVSVYRGDTQDFLNKCRRSPEYKRQLGRIDHIHVSSPCSGFSDANRTGGKNDHANNERSKDFVEAIRMKMPTIGTFENVQGMWRRKNLHYLKYMLLNLLELGYQVRCCLLQACDYGDPQKRARIFVFCAQSFALLPSLPHKTHGPGRGVPFVTVQDALEDRNRDDQQQEDKAPAYETATTASDTIRLQADTLAPTIRASPSALPLHYAENRRITVQEAAALQSFPEHYEFVGTRSEQYRQIGNAVPVEMATAVARSVRNPLLYLYAQEKGELASFGNFSKHGGENKHH